MVSRHSHIGGTRWVHLWIELKELLHLHTDFSKFFYKTVPQPSQTSPQDDFQQFLYHTSHNLKGPVSRLKGLINLILLEANDKGSQQYVGKIDYEVKQMEKILSKLQNISDVLAVNYEPRECKLDEMLNETLGKYQQLAQEKNIFVRIHAEKNLTIWTKIPLLKVIIDNLVDNAIQYSSSDRDQSSLDISLEKRDGNLHILIEDNGVGIRRGAEERIYDIFFRDSDLSTGGGLGLYMVREALKKLGGAISLQSEEGAYSRFSLVVPEENPVSAKQSIGKLKRNL